MTLLHWKDRSARRARRRGEDAAPTLTGQRAGRRTRRAWSGGRIEALEGRLLLAVDLMTAENQRALNIVPDALFFSSKTPFDSSTWTAVPNGYFSVAKDGAWEDPATWNTGTVPPDGANVLIAPGTTVTVRADDAVRTVVNTDGTTTKVRNAVNLLRVDGTLRFDTAGLVSNPNALRRLLVDTIVVSPQNFQVKDEKGNLVWNYTNDEATADTGGVFLMGNDVTDADGNVTSTTPIPYGVKAEVVFADNGAVASKDFSTPDSFTLDASQSNDPYQLRRGLIGMGRVRVYGTEVASFLAVKPNMADGSTALGPHTNLDKNNKPQPVTQITLAAVPADWHVGDRLIIGGNTAANGSGVNQDEQAAIAAINGNTITLNDPSKPAAGDGAFKGLVYDHVAPAGSSVYVADVTRNAVFRSEIVVTYDANGKPVAVSPVADRGHVIFMHDMDVHLDGAGFYGLGRTDKRNPIDDPVIVQDYKFDPATNGPIAVPGRFTDDVLDTRNPALAKYNYRVMVPVVDAAGNPVLNSDGTPKLQIARSGLNPRARYAVHFHHCMPMCDDPMSDDCYDPPDLTNDCAVVDSPGWGIVNHSSDVSISNNVVFNAVGAAFVTEAGDEVGSFDHNIAIHSLGSGAGIESRQQFDDFGHQGDGFWFQGGNVSVTNNVAVGQRHSGFVFFPVGLSPTLQTAPGTKPVTFSTTILASTLPDDLRKLFKDTDRVPVGDIPLIKFVGNTAYGDADGFESWFSLLNVKASDPRRTVVKNFTVFNVSGSGLFDPYTNKITFDHVTVLGTPNARTNDWFAPTRVNGNSAFGRNHVTANATYDHVTVAGYATGIDAPVNGVNTVIAGTFENVRNIYVSTASTVDRLVDIKDASATDPVKFLALPASTAKPADQYDIFLQTNYNPFERDLTDFFNPDVIRLGVVKLQGKQIYYNEQAAGFVPFPDPATNPGAKTPDWVPKELLDLTTQQMMDRYGIAIGGVVAPASARPYTRAADGYAINGLVGPSSDYPFRLQLSSAKYSQFAQNKTDADNDYTKVPSYYLAYKYLDPATGKWVSVNEKTAKLDPTTLHQGWNLVTRTVAGTTRTLLVYGDDIAPDFVPASNVPWTINRADFDNNAVWVLEGQITDDSFGSRFFRHNFVLGDSHFFSPIHQGTDANGNPLVDKDGKPVYVTTFKMVVTDFANNKKSWSRDLVVTDTAPLQKDLGRKNLPNITPSDTLIALILLDPEIPKKK